MVNDKFTEHDEDWIDELPTVEQTVQRHRTEVEAIVNNKPRDPKLNPSVDAAHPRPLKFAEHCIWFIFDGKSGDDFKEFFMTKEEEDFREYFDPEKLTKQDYREALLEYINQQDKALENAKDYIAKIEANKEARKATTLDSGTSAHSTENPIPNPSNAPSAEHETEKPETPQAPPQ